MGADRPGVCTRVSARLFPGERAALPQYGLNVRAPFAAPRGFPAALLTVAAAARVKFRFLPTRPGWVGGTALYYPVIAAAQPAPCHPSPQAGVPLGGEANDWASDYADERRQLKR